MTTATRGWERCRGCLRLRSTLDNRGVCPQCKPKADAGSITLHPAGEGVPAPALPADPAPAPVEAPAAEPDPVPAPQMVAPPTEGWLAPNEPLAAEPKQKPVKRRWWKRGK